MDGTGHETTGFARHLAALKQRGCTVLVVGDVPGGVAMCRGLLGRHGLDRRHVLVPTTTSVADLLSRRGATGRDPDRLGVVDASGAARNGVTAASAGPAAIDRTADWYSEVDDLTDLPALVREIGAHVRRVSPMEPEPGDVRLCIDSLDPFVDAVDEPTLFRFLHVLGGVVRGVHGLGHVHVAPGPFADIPYTESVFDATVHVRTDADGSSLQRWTVQATGEETGWLPVEADGRQFE